MNNTIAEFGFNKDIGEIVTTSWECMGTKYNFNLKGNVLGVFQANNKDYLLTQITDSFGDNCMAGTIDAREVTTESEENSHYILISNNEPTEECMTISRMLSTKDTREELENGKPIEFTKGFDSLEKLGIKLDKQDVQFDERVIVCGVEQEQFKKLKTSTKGKLR